MTLGRQSGHGQCSSFSSCNPQHVRMKDQKRTWVSRHQLAWVVRIFYGATQREHGPRDRGEAVVTVFRPLGYSFT